MRTTFSNQIGQWAFIESKSGRPDSDQRNRDERGAFELACGSVGRVKVRAVTRRLVGRNDSRSARDAWRRGPDGEDNRYSLTARCARIELQFVGSKDELPVPFRGSSLSRRRGDSPSFDLYATVEGAA